MQFIIKDGVLQNILQPEVDIHIPDGVIKLSADVFNMNDITKNVYFPQSLIDCSEYRSLIFRSQENVFVDVNNPKFSSYNGVLYNKNQTILLRCPMGKRGTYETAPTTKEIAQDAFCCSVLEELILNEGLESIHRWAFSDDCIKKPILIPRSVHHISDKAFEGEYSGGNVVVYPNSYAHEYAKKSKDVRFTCVPYDNIFAWNNWTWYRLFQAAKNEKDYVNLHLLRQKVFESTLEIVKERRYQLEDGDIITLKLDKNICVNTVFYSKEIPVINLPAKYNTQITAVSDDCLAFARRVCIIEDDVCVLNMASRRNPGGGVINGAGAQEEYLFRCSDYFRSLYQFVPYAEEYGIRRSGDSYPMDRNFGGIFTRNVTVFRDTEEMGYRLLHHPWRVNMIAVAGMKRPALVSVNGEPRIVSELVESIKNKIRTILRIAAVNGQKTLILGALGCGAFENPPKHTAELFKEILAEPEFSNIFRRVFFVIKEDHNSCGTGNFIPFAEVFGSMKSDKRLEPEGLLLINTNRLQIDTNKEESFLHRRYTPEQIIRLKSNEVFVFGTNPEGKHNSAAAKLAVKEFGAQDGKGEGYSGQSYAIPVHKHRIEKMQEAVFRFISFAKINKDKIFYVLPIGCGNAGMDPLTVAIMFRDAIGLKNIILPKIFLNALNNIGYKNLMQIDLRTGKLLHRESFGHGLQWSLYGDGTLEISGNGAMPNYTNHWDSYFGEDQPKWIGCEKYGVMPYRLIIASGITHVGDNAFESFGCLKEVFLSDTVTDLGKMAFFDCFNIKKINIPPHLKPKDLDKAELPLFYNKNYVRIVNWLFDKEMFSKITQ